MSTPRDTGKIFEELKAVIRDLDGRVGTPVSNVNGVVSNAALARPPVAESSWYVTSTDEVRGPTTLYNVANAISYEQPGFSPVIAVDGKVTFTPPENEISRTHLFLTSAKVQGPTSFPITVDAPGYDIYIYVGRNNVSSGSARVTHTPNLTLGDTPIFVVLSGGTGSISISTPKAVEANAKIPSPAAPFWSAEPTSEYLNNEAGSLVIDLEWSNDAYAGSWSVYRATAISLGVPDTVVDLGGNEFRITYNSVDLRGATPPGTTLYTDEWTAGVVQTITYSVNTEITISLDEGASTNVAEWEVTAFKYPGTFYARARLGYDFTSEVGWRDTDVRRDTLYFYKITAHDFLSGSAESSFSPLVAVYPGKGPIGISVPAHAWLPRPTTVDGNLWLELTMIPAAGVRSAHIRAVGTDASGAFDIEYDLNFSAVGQATRHIVKVGAWDGSAGDIYNQYWVETSSNNAIYITPYDLTDGAAGSGTPGNTYEFLVPRVFESNININAYEQMLEVELDGTADFLTVWDTDENKTKKIIVEDFVAASGVVPINLGDLQNVDETTTPPILNDILTYDGGSWVPASLSAGEISGLSAAIDARLDTNQVISGSWTFNTDVDFGAYIQLDNSFVPGGAPDSGFTGVWSTGDNLFFQTSAGSVRTVLHDGDTITVSASDLDPGTIPGAVIWNGDTIAEAYGGTGETTYAQGDILVGDAGTGLSKLGIGTSGQILASNGTTAFWSDNSVNASSVGAGVFPSGVFSFQGETRFSTGGTSKQGLSLRNDSTPGDDPTSGYTGIWSTGDNLFFQEGGPNTVREVLHDGWSGIITGSWEFSSNLELAGSLVDSTNPASSFLDLKDTSNRVVLASVGTMGFIIDANNNASDSFIWAHGNPALGSATQLMTLDESGNLGINGDRLTIDANGYVSDIESTGFHEGLWIGRNLRYSGSGDPLTNAEYTNAAGANSAAGVALFLRGNGGEGGQYFDFYTAPTSTGAGDPATLTRRLRVNSQGIDVVGDIAVSDDITMTGATPVFSMASATDSTFFSWSGGGIRRITNQGGAAIFGDSSMWIHAGDGITSHVTAASITPTTIDEHLYLTADSNVIIASSTQTNWASRHQWLFANNGATTFPGGGIISATDVITGMTWNGSTVGVQYGGTGLTDVQIDRGDLLWANADGTLTTLAWVDSGRYLQSAGSPGSETLQWVDGIDAGDVGDGTFTGNFSFSADVMINQPDYGIWVKTDGTPSSDPPANYTGIFSTGDNLRFKHNTTGIRDVVHDAWSGTISGSVFLSGTTRFGTNTSQGAAWTDNTATSLDQHQIGDLSGSWGILGRVGVGQNFGISAASANNAILSRILMSSSGIALQYGTTTRMNVTSTGATVTGVLSVTDDVLFNTSDETLKNILGIIDDPVARFRELGDGVFYTWNDEARELGHMDTEVRAGLIAQKVKKALGPATYVDSDGKLGYKPEMLDALIVTVLQEVLDRLEVLENGER